jgi:hypothetical protein
MKIAEEVPDIQAIVSVILGLFIQLLYPGKLRRVGLCKFSFLPSAFSTSALCFSDSLRYLAITFSCFRLVQAALSSAIFRACVSASASSLAFFIYCCRLHNPFRGQLLRQREGLPKTKVSTKATKKHMQKHNATYTPQASHQILIRAL